MFNKGGKKSAAVLLHACAACKDLDLKRGTKMADIAFALTMPDRSTEEKMRGIALFSALLASSECVNNLQMVSNVMKVLASFTEDKQPSSLKEAASKILSILQIN